MKIDASTVEKYQLILEKDPNSQVFAPLAEAYRSMGMLQEALRTVTVGVQRHPQFVSGLVTYGKILRDAGEFKKAVETLKRATTLAPENILAHHLLAEIYISSKNPKEALKAFKMVLFLNPQSKSAQKAVHKLESLTADEYDEDVFAMTKLPDVQLDKNSAKIEKDPSSLVMKPLPSTPNKALERMLSLIDAFIVRNDIEKAHTLIKDTRKEFGDHPEIERRQKTLHIRYNETEEATPLRPLQPRDQVIRERKIEILEMMLRKIEDYRTQG
ncbi:MAG: tetratricopeptide repeat protein [Pseudobdellovibrionaceae bacterium]